MDTENHVKLDPYLDYFMHEQRAADDQRFPVVLTVRPGTLESVESVVVASGGILRTRLAPIHALSAWIPISVIRTLVLRDDVLEIDMVRATTIA